MTIDQIKLIFDYNYWANGRLLAAAAHVSQEQFETAAVAPSLRHTMLHILDAEYGWRMLCQYNQFSEELTETDYPTLEAVQNHWQAKHRRCGLT